ncbi:MAG: glycerophosphodiester phosphodiesterase [Dehalococcoidia bacterium]
MDPGGRRPVRIAHAHGNRRHTIDEALAADIDFMEADLWFRAGHIEVRHERRLGFLPVLYDGKPPGVRRFGPWAITIFPGYYIRLDVNPLPLRELLDRARGRVRLLLDLKGRYSEHDAGAYARTLARTLAEADAEGSAIVCGQTDALDHVRDVAPHLDVRYSMEREEQWQAFKRRLESGPPIAGVCIHRRFFLRDGVAEFLAENSLQAFCWTVDDPAEARALVERGAAGIISNRLPLLEALGEG